MRYEGNFVNGSYEGYGELQTGSNKSFKGFWLRNKPHGYGKLSSRGTYYTGDFVEGVKSGHARVWSDNSENFYIGHF